MRLLIDGYNLLHATDLFGAGEAEGTLRGSREALLAFLADRLTPRERRDTVIVFDSADAPPGLPSRTEHEGIDVRFARDFADADAMIEHLLEGVHGARQLTVVSGDRRVQRAARSAGAKWVDSGPWFAELKRRGPTQIGADETPRESIGDPAAWAAEFDDPAALEAIAREAADAPPPVPPPRPTPEPRGEANEEPRSKRPAKPRRRKKASRPPLSESSDKPTGGFGAGVFDPFPPGYGSDLLDSEENPGAGGDSDA